MWKFCSLSITEYSVTWFDAFRAYVIVFLFKGTSGSDKIKELSKQKLSKLELTPQKDAQS